MRQAAGGSNAGVPPVTRLMGDQAGDGIVLHP